MSPEAKQARLSASRPREAFLAREGWSVHKDDNDNNKEDCRVADKGPSVFSRAAQPGQLSANVKSFVAWQTGITHPAEEGRHSHVIMFSGSVVHNDADNNGNDDGNMTQKCRPASQEQLGLNLCKGQFKYFWSYSSGAV